VTLPERGECNALRRVARLRRRPSIKTRVHDFGAHVPPLPPWGGVRRGPHEGKLQRLGVFYHDMRSLELLQAPTTS
jgi:hypothetical protein